MFDQGFFDRGLGGDFGRPRGHGGFGQERFQDRGFPGGLPESSDDAEDSDTGENAPQNNSSSVVPEGTALF
jgi:hypothetical protein